MSQLLVVCERQHRVRSHVPVPCECGGHELYVCRMRVGNKPCGWSILVPARSRACNPDDV